MRVLREPLDGQLGMRARMDEKTFVSLWAEGRSMTMEQAIEYALKGDMS